MGIIRWITRFPRKFCSEESIKVDSVSSTRTEEVLAHAWWRRAHQRPDLWQMRSKHLNFKTVNYFVKHDLVKGLPAEVMKKGSLRSFPARKEDQSIVQEQDRGAQHVKSIRAAPHGFVRSSYALVRRRKELYSYYNWWFFTLHSYCNQTTRQSSIMTPWWISVRSTESTMSTQLHENPSRTD